MYLIDLVCFDDLTVKQCRIETEEAKDEFLVHCLFDERAVTGIGDSMFTAFQKLMDQLYAMHYGMKCQGAKQNAMQSAMAYASDKIYLLTLGQQAMKKDLGSMFEPVELTMYCRSDEQLEYAQQWLASL